MPYPTEETGPDVDALFAIARVILARAEVARRSNQTVDTDKETASDFAYGAIAWSDETMAYMESDSERFAVPAELEYSLGDALRNPEDPLNQISDAYAFEIGFDVAMKIAARIFAAPLAPHDVDDILAEGQESYLKWLKYFRNEYFKFSWQDRLARAKARHLIDFPHEAASPIGAANG